MKLYLISLLLVVALIRPSSSELCHPQDKKVLLQIKQAFNNPYVLSSWHPDVDCCDWYTVECDLTTHHIISLEIMNDNAISGSIPPQVGDLPYLTTLQFLKLPNINGPIQPAIAKLKSLKFLRLTGTKISGSVPSFLSELKSLTFLDISFNSLTGSIPSSLSSLLNLDALHLEGNKLIGEIPDSFGNSQGKVPDMHLSRNSLSGKIPASFVKLDKLELFDVSYNRLCGMIPVGGKLQSFDITSYSHNKCLCGAPLPSCQ